MNIPAALLIGDILALLAATWIGFATHGGSILSARWLTTFVPLLAAWALVAPWLGLYRAEVTGRPAEAWRALLALLIGGPLAATLRAVMLNGTVIPVFAGVLSASAGLVMAAWRLGWTFWQARRAHRQPERGASHG